MRARFLLLPIALLLPGAAKAASFDCAKAASRVEKVICAYTELSKLDDRMATIYKTRLGAWDGRIAKSVRADQREYLAQIRSIDKPDGEIEPLCPATPDSALVPCLSGAMTRRIGELENPLYPLKGVYRLGDTGLLVIRPAPEAGKIGYILGERHGGPDDPGTFWIGDPDDTQAVRVHGDATLEIMFVAEGKEGVCTLPARFTANAVTIDQPQECGEHDVAGYYLRREDENPSAWELDLHF